METHKPGFFGGRITRDAEAATRGDREERRGEVLGETLMYIPEFARIRSAGPFVLLAGQIRDPIPTHSLAVFSTKVCNRQNPRPSPRLGRAAIRRPWKNEK